MRDWRGSAAGYLLLWYQVSTALDRQVGQETPALFPFNDPALNENQAHILQSVGFQSQQCIIIYHTHNETLEWSSCSGLVVMVPVITDFGLESRETKPSSLSLPVPAP